METTHDETDLTFSPDTGEMPGLASFSSHVGEKFDVLVPKGSSQLELVEAKPLSAQTGAPPEDGFSLVFKSAIDCTLAQGSVALEHEKIGWIVLFLVPTGEDEESKYFEARLD